jgi:hypothetical protein
MSTTNCKVAILSGAIAVLGLFSVAASPASSSQHNATSTNATTTDAKSESVTQKPMNQPTMRQQPMMQPSSEGGCSCCKNMMGGNMSGMMNHNQGNMMQRMPGMMRMPNSSK